MTDIVERLRDNSGRHINGLYDREAADEIERLRAALDAAVGPTWRDKVLQAALAAVIAKNAEQPAGIASQPASSSERP